MQIRHLLPATIAVVALILAGCGGDDTGPPVAIDQVEGNGPTTSDIKDGVVLRGSGFEDGDVVEIRDPSDGSPSLKG